MKNITLKYLCLFLLISSAAQASTMVLMQFETAAERGEGSACYTLARAYLTGQFLFETGAAEGRPVSVQFVCEKDKDKALAYLDKGCELGDVQALTYAHYIYKIGDLVEKDVSKSEEVWEKAYAKDPVEAQYSLAQNYLNDAESPGDIFEGKPFELLNSAATAGHASAQYDLGSLLLAGSRYDDIEKGIKWLRKSADQGHLGAMRTYIRVGVNLDRLADEPYLAAAYHALLISKLKEEAKAEMLFSLGMHLQKSIFDLVPDTRKASLLIETVLMFIKANELDDSTPQGILSHLSNEDLNKAKSNEQANETLGIISSVESLDDRKLMLYLSSLGDIEATRQYLSKLIDEASNHDGAIRFLHSFVEKMGDGIIDRLKSEFNEGIQESACLLYGYYMRLGHQGNAYHYAETAANAGMQMAQVHLGVMFLGDDANDQDKVKAIKYLNMAVEQHYDATAVYMLGRTYLNSESQEEQKKGLVLLTQLSKSKVRDTTVGLAMREMGIYHLNSESYEEGRNWLVKASDRGENTSSMELAQIYREGIGVSKQYAEARRYYVRAAETGIAEAQYALFEIYSEGLGVPQDYVEAYKWLNIVISQDRASTDENLEAYRKERTKLSKLMTPAQIAEAQERSSQWFKAFEARPDEEKIQHL